MPFPFVPVAIAAAAGSAIAGIIGANNRVDPEAIQRERIRLALDNLDKFYTKQRERTYKLAERDKSLARSSGGRQAAAIGYATPGVFTAPALGNISRQTSGMIESLDAQQESGRARIENSMLDFPIINKPGAWDYLGGALGEASKIAGTAYALSGANPGTPGSSGSPPSLSPSATSFSLPEPTLVPFEDFNKPGSMETDNPLTSTNAGIDRYGSAFNVGSPVKGLGIGSQSLDMEDFYGFKSTGKKPTSIFDLGLNYSADNRFKGF